MRQKGFVLLHVLLIIVLVGLIVFVAYQSIKTNDTIKEIKTSISNNLVATSPPVTKTASPLLTPSPTVTKTPMSSDTPTSTPSPKTFEEEERLMRRTIAGFEMYVAGSNTAGALSFFTPPQTSQAKTKYEEIRTQNLPFTLKSWSFVEDGAGLLATEDLKGGYRVRMKECRSNSNTCPLLFLEMVRSDQAENGFMVDRYYTTEYAYQNNLGEEIKYQGFGL